VSAPASQHAELSAAAREALAACYSILLRLADEAANERKEAAPTVQVEAADVDSPKLQHPKGTPTMNSSMHYTPPLATAPSDRALGAESKPGLGSGRRPRRRGESRP
jgi:hypothetical protein